jgi:hypothetical protein
MKNKLRSRFVFILTLATICICISSCVTTTYTNTSSTTKYVTYEMKPDDVRLTWCNHPLFSFEYPSVFELSDLNKVEDLVVSVINSKVEFVCHETDIAYRRLSVTVYEPWQGHYLNAVDLLNDWINSEEFTSNPIQKKITISGIPATYIQSRETLVGVQEVFRIIAFDYQGLIWETMMATQFYESPEPSEIQTSFDHLVDTFKIFEPNYSVHSDNNLNIVVEYVKGVFHITNHEQYNLYEVKIYLDYQVYDISSGYVYDSPFLYGIPSGQTAEIKA